MAAARHPLADQRLLIVEDERLWAAELQAYLEGVRAEAFLAATLAEARALLERQNFDALLLDLHLPDGSGLELLTSGAAGALPVIVMTAEGGVDAAVEALRAGAADYLAKPFEPEELPLVFQRMHRQHRRERLERYERERDHGKAGELFFGSGLEALHRDVLRVLEADRRLGQHLPPVLISGETGTGKSTLARWLHREGPRARQPLIEVNCATLPEALAASELFGHEKGAFTDARTARMGLFEAADGGTLFLDEIAALSPAVQAKVLTAVEDQAIRRVGATRAHTVDVRLIAASLHDLPERVAEGSFREDLYHRLALITLRLPPLRERPEDLLPLAEHLLARLCERYRLPRAQLSSTGRARLCTYTWPGNIRELAHELERALIFEDPAALGLSALPLESKTEPPEGTPPPLLNPQWALPEDGFAFEAELEALQHSVLTRALEQSGHNVSAAARLLGVPRDFVRYRMRNSPGEA